MNYLFTFLIFIFFHFNINAQIVKGTVIDAETQESLTYVHIGIEGKNIGTVSNENGIYKIDLQQKYQEDSITFSMLGYKTRKIAIASTLNKDTVLVALEPLSYAIEKIQISEKALKPRNKKNRKIGRKIGRSNYTGSSSMGWGGEIGIKIKGRKNPQKVLDINFKVMPLVSGSVLFRVNMYTIKDKLPHQSILTQPLYIMGLKGQSWVRKNISDAGIFFQEDVIITIESVNAWSSEGNRYGVFYSNGRLYQSKTYTKGQSMGQWNIGNQPKLTLYITVKDYEK